MSGEVFKIEALPMNRFDPKIYKGQPNFIDFVILDKNKKPVDLVDKSLTVIATNIQTNERAFERDLIIKDAKKGYAQLRINENDIVDLPKGFYKYSINFLSNDEGFEGYLYTNQAYNAIGNFELLDGPVTPTPSIDVTIFNQFDSDFFSGFFPGSSTLNYVNSLHTVSFHMTNYLGTIKVQGTLDPQPSQDPNAWFDIITYENLQDPLTGVIYQNFDYSLNWVRFKYTPSNDNTGTVNKILYRP